MGQGRAKDLAVNVVLPFVHAWDNLRARESGDEKSLVESETEELGNPESLYRRYSLLADNEIIREMTDQLLPVQLRVAVSNARRQQGLLHLSEVLKGAF